MRRLRRGGPAGDALHPRTRASSPRSPPGRARASGASPARWSRSPLLKAQLVERRGDTFRLDGGGHRARLLPRSARTCRGSPARSTALELCRELVRDHEPHPELFELLVEYLGAARSERRPGPTSLLAFELDALAHAGLHAALRLPARSAAASSASAPRFDPEHGGAVCESLRARAPHGVRGGRRSWSTALARAPGGTSARRCPPELRAARARAAQPLHRPPPGAEAQERGLHGPGGAGLMRQSTGRDLRGRGAGRLPPERSGPARARRGDAGAAARAARPRTWRWGWRGWARRARWWAWSGEDEFGHFLREQPRRARAWTSATCGRPTRGRPGWCSSRSTETGERSFSFYRTRAAEFFLASATWTRRFLASARALHFGTNSLLCDRRAAGGAAIVQAAAAPGGSSAPIRTCGCTFWADPSELRPSDRRIPALHGGEARRGRDRVRHRHEDVERALDRLRGRGVPLPVVTLGPRGARLLVGDRVVSVEPVPVNVVDTTGAGDGFVSAMLFALTRTYGSRAALARAHVGEIRQIAEFACMAGARVCEKIGAVSGVAADRGTESGARVSEGVRSSRSPVTSGACCETTRHGVDASPAERTTERLCCECRERRGRPGFRRFRPRHASKRLTGWSATVRSAPCWFVSFPVSVTATSNAKSPMIP